MAIDLKSLNAQQLKKLIDDAKREHTRLQKRAPVEKVRTKLTRMAAAEGYTLVELFGIKSGALPKTGTPSSAEKRGGVRSSTKGVKVAAKYRNPANPSETWSGRGKHPRWMATEIANGRKAEDFLI
jgi:DNA-binding protein H-NS